MERIIIFIDNSNIFKGFRKYNIKADYEKLKNVIASSRELKDIFLYEGVVYPMSPLKKKWYEDLKSNSGYVIKASFDKIAGNDAIEKKIDIKMAIDIISLAYENAFDTAVLLSGDGDFIPVVNKLKEMNKPVELWGFKYSLSHALMNKIEEGNLFYLDDILMNISIVNKEIPKEPDEDLIQKVIDPKTERNITGEYISNRLKELEGEAGAMIKEALAELATNPTKKHDIYDRTYWLIHERLGMGSIGPATAAAGPLMANMKQKLAVELGIDDKDIIF